MNFDLRPATAADLPAIQAIYAHHVLRGTGTFELEPPSLAEMAQRQAAIAGAGLPFLVGETGGAVAGYAYAGPFRARPAYRFLVEDSIYLHPDWLGRGLGRALLDRLLAESEAWGARQMAAVIGDSANQASIRLHAAAGFAHTGTLRAVGYKFGRWLDVVFMQRALGAGDQTLPE
jgi:phosphinothricin acetyltransferase